MPQIFGCPYCQNSFGVPDDAAGQTFECPSCDQVVEVPDLSVPEQAAEPDVFRCPHCDGKFGIDSSMYGQHLACPHCAKHVAIVKPVEREVFDAIIEDDPVVVPPPTFPQVSGNKSSSKKRSVKKDAAKKDASKRAAPEQGRAKKEPRPKTKETVTRQVAPPRKKEATEKANVTTPKQRPASSKPREKKKAPTVERTSPVEKRVPAPKPPSPVAASANPEAAHDSVARLSIAHLLPPTFDVPDPVRFPRKIGANEVLLPDGQGGYQTAEANVVTITYRGQVYHLQRLSPEERRKRQIIHNTVGISIAVLLIFLTLQTIGLFS